MKLLTAKEIRNSWKLFDENYNLVGERMFIGFWGNGKQLRINDKIYTIRNIGFFTSEIHYEDENGKLLLKIDYVHQRVFYYNKSVTEIYYLKSKSWSKNFSLYQFENDKLVMSFKHKRSFLKSAFEIEIDTYFTNNLLILAFLDYNLRNFED